jgi:uncharacterized repeat protein (TIGR02543 family)
MKQIFLSILVMAVMIFSVALTTSCKKNDKTVEYTVKFDADGGVPEPADQKVKESETLTEPPAMTKVEHIFDGWYKDAEKWNFATGKVTADMTLKAKWAENSRGTMRYRTVPIETGSAIVGASLKSGLKTGSNNAAVKGDHYEMIFCAYDDNAFYYLYELGHVNSVPVTWADAYIYNGVTPITISYSRTTITETTITQGIEKTYENSFESSDNVMAGLNVTGGYKSVAGWHVSASAYAEYQHTWTHGERRATANTYETATTKGLEITNAVEATIGQHGEPAGKYRYSLFGTTDVFFVLVTNKAKTEIIDAYISVNARPSSYAWGIDYEPDLGGDFGKTAPGKLMQIPNVEDKLALLPDPTTEGTELIPPRKAETPTASPRGGTNVNPVQVTLTAEEGVIIYYTTDNTTPTEASTRYLSPITIDKETILRAVAYIDGSEPSEQMFEAYTFEATPLKTISTTWNSGPRTIRVTDSRTQRDYLTHDLNVQALQEAGYTGYYITIVYDWRAVIDGYKELFVRLSWDHNGQRIGSRYTDMGPYLGKGWQTNWQKTTDLRPISDLTSSQFHLEWFASGAGSDEYDLGTTQVTVHAKKP